MEAASSSAPVLPSVAGYLDLTLSPSIFAILDWRRISKLRGLNLVCLPSAFRNYWLAATSMVLFLELLRTTSSEPCPPSHTITSPTDPQSYLKIL
ncbi:hypothetical protein AMECASPLE_008858 [Ameca splendens]|uniref:Uncharacterized protein n=1 Tax=Ameca splendens TaxID=208324 RepID=A0ABV0XD52_9TELE